MAYIAKFIIDAENIFNAISERQADRESRIHDYYKAARTIQRWFRGYITRKHLIFLSDQATIIQKHWRGHLARHLYFKLLKQRVKEFYEENYNRLATIIQKTWRGYLYREYVFSYLKLKKWKLDVLKRNKFLLQMTKNYELNTWKLICKKMEQEAEEWLAYILFKTHHLLRTQKRKGVYSLPGDTNKYSSIEELIKSISFVDYMKEKKLSEAVVKGSLDYEYKFQGVYRKCEDAWLQRYAPNVHSVFSSGVYGEEKEILEFNDKQAQDALIIHDERMKFPLGKCKCVEDAKEYLTYKTHTCPPKHHSPHTTRTKDKENWHELIYFERRRAKFLVTARKFVEELLQEAQFRKEKLLEKSMYIVEMIIDEAKEEIIEEATEALEKEYQ